MTRSPRSQRGERPAEPATPRAKKLVETAADADKARLLHELQVHQAELETQNEELRRARTQAEEALQGYTQLFDFAPLAYVTLDRDERVLKVNHAARHLFGVKLGFATKSLAQFVSVADRPILSTLVRSAFEREKTVNCEAVFRRSAGSETSEFLGHATATVMNHGGASVILLSVEDIADRRENERKLLAEKELREAALRKDEFLAMLSHELRNPLGPIRTGLFLVSKAKAGSEEANRSWHVINRQVSHLTRLVDDLLDVTRITRAKIQLQKEQLDLAAVVRRTLEDNEAALEARGVRLESQLDAGPVWIQGDAARIVQVISNLLGNANKFTPTGGSTVVSLERNGENAVLRVSDTGAGIACQEIGRVFEPFTQAPQTLDRTRGGLGLGLPMVKGLVELHGGSVGIYSDGPGRGTLVTVALPLERDAIRPSQVPPPSSASRRRILVIEDNTDAADMLKTALALSSHDVEVAYDGPAGIELARAFHPEVVLCDIGLPQMDGYAVARAFRAEEVFRDTYLVALSGYAQVEDRRLAAAAGFNQHMAKPVDMDVLNGLLADVPALPASPG